MIDTFKKKFFFDFACLPDQTEIKHISQATVVDIVQAEKDPLPSLYSDGAWKTAFAPFMEETDENYLKHIMTKWTRQLFKTLLAVISDHFWLQV